MSVNNISSSDSLTSRFGAIQDKAALSTNGGFAAKLDSAMNKTSDDADTAKLKKVCRDLESVFLNYMMTTMRATVPKDTLTGDGPEKEIYQSLFDTELTTQVAQAGGMGLADMIYRQLSSDMKSKNQAPK